ncbi:MAG TPA: hypothetical protein VHF07_05415, partial [Nitrospiraceae bacterium]|nr:hypothetical protein [Nitrospiraceae bacterium]
MASPSATAESVFRLSARLSVLPILHGSGDMAQEVREFLITRPVDCLAVPLPPSFETPVEQAVDELPTIHVVCCREPEQGEEQTVNYVPVDPCQAVIMGIRVAMGERIPRAYIDRDVAMFEPSPFSAPDPFALKQVPVAAFAASLTPVLAAPADGSQQQARISWMAFQLHQLELEYHSIVCLCHIADWPWLRTAYQERLPYQEPEKPAASPERYRVDADTLYFVLGELPFVTELYERRRAELRSDRLVAIDGLKELLLEARARWRRSSPQDGGPIPNWVTPQLLQLYLQYVRNHALLDRRLTPDLYTLVLGAKQMAGDQFAIHVFETAKHYGYPDDEAGSYQALGTLSAGLGKFELPDGTVVAAKNRLQGPPLQWRSLSLRPLPSRARQRRLSYRWNPYRQCSWPPEDHKIESFNTHVRDQAKALIGADLAKVEKFTTSIKDGIDIRESLRHWYRRHKPGQPARLDIYVREIPPARGNVDTVIFLFDIPADAERYTWRATWYAEHQEESTLCFYATPFLEQMVGPGVGQSCYGGALFLFPPRPIP